MKGLSLIGVLAFFVWLVIQLDKLPIVPDGMETAKIDAVDPIPSRPPKKKDT
jgi:hypothetical protein